MLVGKAGAANRSQCGGSEVRIIAAAGSSCGLLNQSHTRSKGLLVSFRFRSSKCGSAKRDELRNRGLAMHRNGAIQFIKTNATLIALVVLTVALALADPTFHTARNLSNVARQVTIVGIIGGGMTMVILIAGIDLSLGWVVGVGAVVVTLLMQIGMAAWIAVPLTLVVVGGLIGLWNGFWIARYRIPPFIITLGMLTIARGVALTLSGGSSVPVADPSFANIGSAYIPPVPTLVILGVAAVLYVTRLVRGLGDSTKS